MLPFTGTCQLFRSKNVTFYKTAFRLLHWICGEVFFLKLFCLPCSQHLWGRACCHLCPVMMGIQVFFSTLQHNVHVKRYSDGLQVSSNAKFLFQLHRIGRHINLHLICRLVVRRLISGASSGMILAGHDLPSWTCLLLI